MRYSAAAFHPLRAKNNPSNPFPVTPRPTVFSLAIARTNRTLKVWFTDPSNFYFIFPSLISYTYTLTENPCGISMSTWVNMPSEDAECVDSRWASSSNREL